MAKKGNEWTNYSYEVPGGFHGMYSDLQVLGDKKGGQTTLRLRDDSSLLTKLQDVVKVPIALLHCVRNPYDNITSMALKSNRTIDEVIEDYAWRVHCIDTLHSELPKGITFHELSNEALIANPAQVMTELLDFLGLPITQSYVKAIQAVVNDKPHRIAKTVAWSDSEKQRVKKLISSISFLKQYEK